MKIVPTSQQFIHVTTMISSGKQIKSHTLDPTNLTIVQTGLKPTTKRLVIQVTPGYQLALESYADLTNATRQSIMKI